MKSLLIGCILACLHLCSNAQSSFISGVLLDNETHEAIPYATITIKEKQEGTLSNAEGKFSLLIKDLQNQDRLTISCVGFETITLSVAELAGNESHSIYLKSKTFTLDDAIVTNQSIPSLLEEAIRTTQAFIPAKQYYEAYYKELAYLDKELYKFSDAAVNYVINDEGRKTKADLYILESRIKQDSISDDEEKAFLRYCNISQEVRFKVGKKKGLLGSKAEILFHSLQEETPENLNKSYSKINIYRSGNNFTTDFWKNRNSLMLTQSEIEILGSILNKNN